MYTDMVNCTLFGDAYQQLSKKRQDRLGEWTNFEDPLENSGDWLPQIVRQIRWGSSAWLLYYRSVLGPLCF